MRFARGDIVEYEPGCIGLIVGWSVEHDAPMLDWIVNPRGIHIYRHAHSEYDWCVGSGLITALTKIGEIKL